MLPSQIDTMQYGSSKEKLESRLTDAIGALKAFEIKMRFALSLAELNKQPDVVIAVPIMRECFAELDAALGGTDE